MSHKPNISLQLTPEQLSRLRNLAQSYGMTVGRGRHMNMGSVRRLAIAIADGELGVLPLHPDDDLVIARLRDLLAEQPDDDHVRDLLDRLEEAVSRLA